MLKVRMLMIALPVLAAAAIALALPPFPPQAVHHDERTLDPPSTFPSVTAEEFTHQWQALESLAESFDAPEYSGLSVREEPRLAEWSWLVRVRDFRGSAAHSEQGGEVSTDVVAAGDPLTPGIYRNMAGVPIVLECAGGFDLLYGEEALVFVHAMVGGTNLGGTSVSVTCAAGYYACCVIGPPPTARCYRNTDTNHVCDGGGIGATACSVSAGTP